MHMLHAMLRKTAESRSSDLLLVAGAAPMMFVNGQWLPLDDEAMMSGQVQKILEPALTPHQRKILQETRDLDTALAVEGVGRFRINVHYQRGDWAVAVRAIPTTIPPFEELALPDQVRRCADFPNGLVLITGPTGQGKTTTLAALIDHMNHTRRCHIVTIEDPIEFSFSHGSCIIEQRQIGDDSPSFSSALRHVLRQRPDVILIGEMRDLETISTALTAAETGHLVLASLHTSGAAQTLARIIDVFPPSQQPHVRTQVAASLRGIVCQTLVHDQLNDRLAPATEILFANSAIRRAIRDNETHLIYGMLETGRRQGMHTLEQSLAELVTTGRVDPRKAQSTATDPLRLCRLIGLDADNGTQNSTDDLDDAAMDVALEASVAASKGRQPLAMQPWAAENGD